MHTSVNVHLRACGCASMREYEHAGMHTCGIRASEHANMRTCTQACVCVCVKKTSSQASVAQNHFYGKWNEPGGVLSLRTWVLQNVNSMCVCGLCMLLEYADNIE